jgi:hypothetical protein
MRATAEPHFIDLYTSSRTELRAQLSAAVDETLRRRSLTLLVGLDSLPNLDDGVLAAAIIALRRLRESGGTLRLKTGNASHRRTLIGDRFGSHFRDPLTIARGRRS